MTNDLQNKCISKIPIRNMHVWNGLIFLKICVFAYRSAKWMAGFGVIDNICEAAIITERTLFYNKGEENMEAHLSGNRVCVSHLFQHSIIIVLATCAPKWYVSMLTSKLSCTDFEHLKWKLWLQLAIWIILPWNSQNYVFSWKKTIEECVVDFSTRCVRCPRFFIFWVVGGFLCW